MSALFGISGLFNTQKATKAFAYLAHRETAPSQTCQTENLFFVHHLPQQNKEETILVALDGKLSNSAELCISLEISSVSDVEIVLAAYKKWNIECIAHLHGMFAIAILDRGKIYLFRDRFGKKPLFYLQTSEAFFFASQIKALVPFLDKVELNQDALMSYLSFLAPTPPHTFFKNIYKLAAGEYLCFSKNQTTTKRYYDFLEMPSSQITDKEEALKKIENLLENSIIQNLNTQKPMAALLSGGIDSATICYFAKQHGKNLPTYTLGYKEHAKYDERQNAKESALSLGITNHHKEINEEEFLSACEKVFDALDEPLNDPAAVPLYLLFEEIKADGYDVVLSGEGSDELFLGYRQYFEYLDIEKASTLLHKNWLKKYFRANFSMNREWEWYKRVFDGSLLFRTSGEKFTDLQKNTLMRRNVKDNESLSYLQEYRERFERSCHKDESIWYSYSDLNLFQAEHFLTKLDRVSQAHAIETRTPFLNQQLAETIFSIDPKLRYKDATTKALLKEIMKDKLDEKILKRKKKGFSNPYMEYLSSSGKLTLIIEVNEKTGLFHKEVLERYINTAIKGNFKQHIWGLYVLSVWIKKYLL